MSTRTLITLIALLLCNVASARTVTIATGEYPPWTGSKLPNHGYVNHVIAESFASVGLSAKFIYLPWKRAFEEAKNGDYDATSYWFDSRDRRTTMLLSEPVIQNRTVFFQRSEDKPVEWKKLSDLAPYRISVTMGFSYTEEFLELISRHQLKIIQVPTDIQNIKMLMSNRVDLIATDEMSGFYMAATLSVDPRKLRVLEPPMTTTHGFLMASKANPKSEKLIADFNRGLQIIKASGKYDRIINRVDNSSFYDPAVKEDPESKF